MQKGIADVIMNIEGEFSVEDVCRELGTKHHNIIESELRSARGVYPVSDNLFMYVPKSRYKRLTDLEKHRLLSYYFNSGEMHTVTEAQEGEDKTEFTSNFIVQMDLYLYLTISLVRENFYSHNKSTTNKDILRHLLAEELNKPEYKTKLSPYLYSLVHMED